MSTHIFGIKTAANVALQEVWDYDGGVTPEADPTLIPLVQYYTHFDLTQEELGRTWRYNCWGFTFIPRRYWINSSNDVDQIIQDNCTPVAPGSLQLGDVIRYRDSSNVTTHTGRVWQIDGSGNCTLVRSKWGPWAEYVHAPDDYHIYQDNVYGKNLAYFRQVAPLKGIGDLWLRDDFSDNGEEHSYSGWASPDILVDAPPYGSVDINPVFGHVNRVSALVHNRGDTDIQNVMVRYYWADPFAGFAPSNWQLIPSTANHPNPTNPFNVPANSNVQAPFVEWTPNPLPGVPDPAHQCLLAVAYFNDNPCDSTNPDPIVYPFDILWDNNIAARNVHIVTIGSGGKSKLHLKLGIPFGHIKETVADVRLRLAYVPKLPIFGYPTKVVLPNVRVTVGDRRPVILGVSKPVEVYGKTWGTKEWIRGIDIELQLGKDLAAILPRLNEKTVALQILRRVPLAIDHPIPLEVEISVPVSGPSKANYILHIEEIIKGEVTGAYHVVIFIT